MWQPRSYNKQRHSGQSSPSSPQYRRRRRRRWQRRGPKRVHIGVEFVRSKTPTTTHTSKYRAHHRDSFSNATTAPLPPPPPPPRPPPPTTTATTTTTTTTTATTTMATATTTTATATTIGPSGSLLRPLVVVALLGGYSKEVEGVLSERGILCFQSNADFQTKILPLLKVRESGRLRNRAETVSMLRFPTNNPFLVQSPPMPCQMRNDLLNLDQTGLCLLLSDVLCNPEHTFADPNFSEYMVKTAMNWYDASIMPPKVDLMTMKEVCNTCNWFRWLILRGKHILLVLESVATKFEQYLAKLGSPSEQQRFHAVTQSVDSVEQAVTIAQFSSPDLPQTIFIVPSEVLSRDQSQYDVRLSSAVWDVTQSTQKNLSTFAKYDKSGMLNFLDFGFSNRLINCTSQNWAMLHMGAFLLPDINLAHSYNVAVDGEVWHTVHLVCKLCGCTGVYKATNGGRKIGMEASAAFSKSRARVIMAHHHGLERMPYATAGTAGTVGQAKNLTDPITYKSRHRFVYEDRDDFPGTPRDNEPHEYWDRNSICKACQNLEKERNSTVARQSRLRQRWYVRP